MCYSFFARGVCVCVMACVTRGAGQGGAAVRQRAGRPHREPTGGAREDADGGNQVCRLLQLWPDHRCRCCCKQHGCSSFLTVVSGALASPSTPGCGRSFRRRRTRCARCMPVEAPPLLLAQRVMAAFALVRSQAMFAGGGQDEARLRRADDKDARRGVKDPGGEGTEGLRRRAWCRLLLTAGRCT
jgi:hypothetical protein